MLVWRDKGDLQYTDTFTIGLWDSTVVKLARSEGNDIYQEFLLEYIQLLWEESFERTENDTPTVYPRRGLTPLGCVIDAREARPVRIESGKFSHDESEFVP